MSTIYCVFNDVTNKNSWEEVKYLSCWHFRLRALDKSSSQRGYRNVCICRNHRELCIPKSSARENAKADIWRQESQSGSIKEARKKMCRIEARDSRHSLFIWQLANLFYFWRNMSRDFESNVPYKKLFD